MDLAAASLAAAGSSGNDTALFVAALGIFGTLAATVLTQWLTGKREERRWIREDERDARHQQEKLAREDVERWHRDRLENYSALVLAVDGWSRIARHGPPKTPDTAERLLEFRSQVGQAIYLTQLLTSSEEVMAKSTSVWMNVVILDPLRERESTDSTREKWRAVDMAVNLLFGEMKQAMRVELGISSAHSTTARSGGL
jgi:type II secretory pathway pseudopilin PulG